MIINVQLVPRLNDVAYTCIDFQSPSHVVCVCFFCVELSGKWSVQTQMIFHDMGLYL